MHKGQYLTRQKTYGKWTLLDAPARRHYVWCRCACGTEKEVGLSNLYSGKTKGCRVCSRTHGLALHPAYPNWYGMRKRCNDPKNSDWKNYGGRGIRVCAEWADDPTAFIEWAEGSGFSKALQIDRIDNNGNYEPANCRWVTPKVNGRNTRRNHLLTARGETKPVSAWAEDERVEASSSLIFIRLRKLGWPVEAAIFTPVGVSFGNNMSASDRSALGKRAAAARWHKPPE